MKKLCNRPDITKCIFAKTNNKGQCIAYCTYKCEDAKHDPPIKDVRLSVRL